MADQHTFTARFEIAAWEETLLPGLGADVAYAATMGKRFIDGIATGSSEGLFIASGAEEGTRSYVAVERISGMLPDGRIGSFTVHHGGLEADADTWFGHIVPGSGTDGLDGLGGSARIEHDAQGAFFTFTLNG